MRKIVFPPSVKNWLSLSGVIIVLTSLFMIIFLFIAGIFIREQAAYLGLITYILLPAVMIIGLLLIPAGMLLKTRRERQGKSVSETRWPRIDLEEPHHRHAFFIFVIGTGFFLLISAVGSYEAFHYSESTRFCGTLCHTVMEPEHVAHQHSPHARVPCVSCHVGPGVDWYMRSKLSGLYQVYAVLADVYPRPIPTPIKNLRPANAVCEQCHWPQQFYGQKQQMQTHYLPDKENTPWLIGLSLKTGPPQAALGLIEGIHWHINPHIRIDYIATDPGRQQIPWVRYTNLDSGEVRIFRDKNQKAPDEKLQETGIRSMDCIDCHNRPSHRYRPPSQFINTAMAAGSIPASLPEIKKIAVKICTSEYPSAEAALSGINDGIMQFYRLNYPEAFARQNDQVKKAVLGVQREFSKNIFPYMKVRWSAYPDNIGHTYHIGCFRCHNGDHVSENGQTIRKDCTICHDITAQGIPKRDLKTAKSGESLEFQHPEDIGNEWQETLCSDCHSG